MIDKDFHDYIEKTGLRLYLLERKIAIIEKFLKIDKTDRSLNVAPQIRRIKHRLLPKQFNAETKIWRAKTTHRNRRKNSE